MKILHIAEFGLRKTGIGTVVERLCKEQMVLGHNVRIATTSLNLAYEHLDIINVQTPKALGQLLQEWSPDAVLFHSIWCMSYIKMAKMLKRYDIPYAVMMHGANSVENFKKGKLKKWVANLLFFNRFLRQAKTIIYLSKTEYDNCVSKHLNPNYAIIPNGCDKVAVDIDAKEINTPVRIVYLGRLIIHHKGLDFLFDALDLLKQKGYCEAKFHFYGNKNDVDIDIIKDRIGRLGDIASYDGPAYENKKIEVLRGADAFILTSRYEGMPMGVLEALTYGVPCILTPGTNMADDVDAAGAGWKVDLQVNEIAKGIVNAVSDLKTKYNSLHQSAYDLSLLYDWKDIAIKHVKVMEIISKKNKKNNILEK